MPQLNPIPAQAPKRLRALLVEDDPDDAQMVIRELERGGYDPITRRVQTAADMTAALAEEQWDVVISDYSMPTFSGPEAFALMRKLELDLPFIIVSGTIGEDVAVEAMRAGVHDFLLKGHLRRLTAAIAREIREAAMRMERSKIERHLLISERMASVGTLAAGVAHEINNPLSVVAANLQIIKEDFEEMLRELETPRTPAQRADFVAAATTSFREASADAVEAAERVRIIARDLRVFSHPDESRHQAVDVEKVLESSIRMARVALRGRAKVVCHFGHVPKARGNEGRLGQVFLNLLVNAAHAIPEGQIQRNTITLTTSCEDDLVIVDVTDTGSGIAPDILPHIFDVFFTTKPVGVGTGLGLAICHRILTALDGRIEVKSQVGVGTTFRVALQRAHAGSTFETLAPPVTALPEGLPAVVLVIDDEEALGRVLPRLLAPHQVTVVTRAREALARIDAGESYDTILCDLMMPDMTGIEFFAELSGRHADLAARVVFMSGGVFSPAMHNFLDKLPNRCLDKPLDIAGLRGLIEASTHRAR